MPTYDYRCATCNSEQSVFQTIAAYTNAPQRPKCCAATMDRKLSVVPAAAGTYALAGDRHYEGMRATDGTDIGSRTKHREYMKANNLTTVDDYQKTWAKAAEDRQALRSATHQDQSLRTDIAQAIQTKTA